MPFVYYPTRFENVIESAIARIRKEGYDNYRTEKFWLELGEEPTFDGKNMNRMQCGRCFGGKPWVDYDRGEW